jgi:hypothetical protein
MTEETARAIIEFNTRDGLPPDAVERLLSMYVTTEPSSAGSDDGVWSVNRASGHGWLLLAGDDKAKMDFKSDGGDFKASQPREFCLRMAETFNGLADAGGEPGGASAVTPFVFRGAAWG